MATELFVESNARKDVLVRSPRAAELAALLTAHGAVAVPAGDGGLGVTGMGAPDDRGPGRRRSVFPCTSSRPGTPRSSRPIWTSPADSVEYRGRNAGRAAASERDLR